MSLPLAGGEGGSGRLHHLRGKVLIPEAIPLFGFSLDSSGNRSFGVTVSVGSRSKPRRRVVLRGFGLSGGARWLVPFWFMGVFLPI